MPRTSTKVNIDSDGAPIEVFQMPDGSFRQVMVIGDPTDDTQTATVINNRLQVESSQTYALKYDAGVTYTYIGEAVPGSLLADDVWRIKRLTNADNTIVWADGDSSFDNVWNDRASLTYS
jgi:hypothetical protein